MSVKACSATWTIIQMKWCSYLAKTDLVALNDNPANFVIILQYLIFDYQHQSSEHFVTATLTHFFSGQKKKEMVKNTVMKTSQPQQQTDLENVPCATVTNSSPKQSKSDMSGCSIVVLNLLTKSLISSVSIYQFDKFESKQNQGRTQCP